MGTETLDIYWKPEQNPFDHVLEREIVTSSRGCLLSVFAVTRGLLFIRGLVGQTSKMCVYGCYCF